MGEAERRRQILADSEYLEMRSRVLLAHSRELIARSQHLRARLHLLWSYCADLWEQRERRPGAVLPRLEAL